LALIIIIIFICSDNTQVLASITDLKNKQAETKKAQEEASSELEAIKSIKKSLLSEMEGFDVELKIAYTELYLSIDELEITEQNLNETILELEAAIEVRREKQELYEERLIFMYVYGRKGYLELLLDSHSISDFFARLLYMENIIRFDQGIVAEMEEIERVIDNNRIAILDKKLEIEKLLERQTNITLGLEETISEKRLLIVQLRNDEERQNEEVQLLEKSSNAIQELINKQLLKEAISSTTGKYTGTGKLLWPLPSSNRITSEYINRNSPISGKKEFHTGLDIGAKSGSPIVAADDGVIIHSGAQGGYGLTTIVSHGNGMTTLYGHSSKLLTSVGQSVKRGETIALVGSTGYSTGPHLHFEVRINGSHTQPRTYLFN
jgi:murein DD-endopeptidase MepM/ murein hydrolase activator NlpD